MLDIFIGLFLAFTLFSLLASTIYELVAAYLNLRGYYLVRGLKRILLNIDDDTSESGEASGLVKQFLSHPRLSMLRADWMPGRWSLAPGYLKKETFSHVLVEALKDGGINKITEKAFDNIPNEGLKKILKEMWAKAKGEGSERTEAFKKEAEDWFDELMGRVTGWYKGRAQLWLFVIGAALAASFNADTINMYNRLSRDEEGRAALVKVAEGMVGKEGEAASLDELKALLLAKNDSLAQDTTTGPTQEIREKKALAGQLIKEIESIKNPLGLGWENAEPFSAKALLGFILTAFAVSLGAPFWFDILKKAVNIRTSGKLPEAEAKNPPGKESGEAKG